MDFCFSCWEKSEDIGQTLFSKRVLKHIDNLISFIYLNKNIVIVGLKDNPDEEQEWKEMAYTMEVHKDGKMVGI